MACGTEGVVAALTAAADTVSAHRNELVELDRVIGDGDHGENLQRGFSTFVVAMSRATPDSPGAVIKLLATTLISTVGGAAGPLYGTACLRAATSIGDGGELTADTVVAALKAALGGVVARGKAEVGDKTMVDALTPAVDAATQALDDGGDIAAVLAAAAEAAEKGAESTVPLVARKGRASYLGERSAGHLDPGARSTSLLLRAFADSAARSAS
ncbi:MAG TPA: dihydroxyacetone kinase subunit DhaL [Pseudonocardiaceae bacterium]|jgi:dihydroxyacetone kinase-like protein|nr:dihydroxyacetone kinase subunit DhaL [Pseudonocardiaceae bacterium]